MHLIHFPFYFWFIEHASAPLIETIHPVQLIIHPVQLTIHPVQLIIHPVQLIIHPVQLIIQYPHGKLKNGFTY